jgi:signal transduction histidine kinase
VLTRRDAPAPAAGRGRRLVDLPRAWPIRWRILAIAVLNSALALVLLALIWNGAKILGAAWLDLRQVRQTERFLGQLDRDAERLQGLIHRYMTRPDETVLARITDLRESLFSRMRVQAQLDPFIAPLSENLTRLTERFIAGFDELKDVRERISFAYDRKLLRPSREMAGLYAIIEGTTPGTRTLIWTALAKSREAYHAMMLAANALYLSSSEAAADEARAQAAIIERTAPVMQELAVDAIQREALGQLQSRAALVARGTDELAEEFRTQARLLRDVIDAATEQMAAAIDRMTGHVREMDKAAQERFDATLADASGRIGLYALAFVSLVVLAGLAVSRSISEPLGDLAGDMHAIVAGDDRHRVEGLGARDEIGDMARALEVFRENASARRRAETALRSAKEGAEVALADLRATQASLVQAEKLAALGGLVAGVAHEINNPVGISLTVASSLGNRCDAIAGQIATGQVRRSQLADFVDGVRDASQQLVTNLHRAGELVQSFKQVAVDRSQAERRAFDLKQVCEQIVASLRPGLKGSAVTLSVDLPDGVAMDSFPGPLGQIVTNLFLNAINHGFDGRPGTMSLSARRRGAAEVEIVFSDDGRGMSEDVRRRAFDPFFTTRRAHGGTGLGLYIVYNLATRRLGGRIGLSSFPEGGTRFVLTLPLVAPEGAAAPAEAVEA